MKKLILLSFILYAALSYGQTLNNTNTKFPNGLAPGNGTTNPTTGVTPGMIFFKTAVGFQYWDGSAWQTVGIAGAGGIQSLGAFGSSPNANGGTITGTVLNFEPANTSFGGGVSTTTQSFAGDKTFTGNILSIKANPSLLLRGTGSPGTAAAGAIFFSNNTVTNTSWALAADLDGSSNIADFKIRSIVLGNGLDALLINHSTLASTFGGAVSAPTLTASSIAALGTAATTFVTQTGGLLQTRTAAQVRSDIGAGTGAGTVTDVAALTLGTTGTDLTSSVANSTTTPVITLNVPTASASNRGALSSTDWSTFNGKAPATGSANYVNIQTGNLIAQTGKFWVSDTIRTSKTIVSDLGGGTNLFLSNVVGLGYKTFTIQNTGASLLFGVDANVGTALFVNSLPYSSSFGTKNNTAVHLATRDTVRYTIGGDGSNTWTKGGTFGSGVSATTLTASSIAALGTAATTFVTQTAGLLQTRTAAQVRSDIGAGTGSGTVTAVSIATANGFSGSSSGGATPALTIVAGAITPTSVNSVVLSGSSTPTLAVTGTSSISGSNTGDQTITLTGDVTGSGTGSFAATLATVNASPGTYGSATQTPVFVVNGKGLVTSNTNTTITPAASSITGGAALTKADDTNVTLTLGGTPSTALLQASSITAGWTGTLAVARGGIGTGTAGIGAFNNITGFSAAGTTGTTSTNLVFSTSPTLITPNIGAATGTSLVASGAAGVTISSTGFTPILNVGLSPDANRVGLLNFISSNSAYNWLQSSNNFTASTLEWTPSTAAGGSTFTTPVMSLTRLGVLTAGSFTGAGTGLTGTAAGLTAGNVTTNANLTGVITSVGNATSIASQTGTGTTFVTSAGPTITGTTTVTTLNYTTLTGAGSSSIATLNTSAGSTTNTLNLRNGGQAVNTGVGIGFNAGAAGTNSGVLKYVQTGATTTRDGDFIMNQTVSGSLTDVFTFSSTGTIKSNAIVMTPPAASGTLATLAGTESFSNKTFTTAITASSTTLTPTVNIGLSPDADRVGYLNFISSNTAYNWLQSSNNFTASNMEWTPSTAAGGSTFTTPVMKLSRVGLLTLGTGTIDFASQTFGAAYDNAASSGTTIVGRFNGVQTVANSGNLQVLQATARMSHTSGTVVLAAAVSAVAYASGAGGTTTDLAVYKAAGNVSAGTVTNYYSFLANAPGSGGTIGTAYSFYGASGSGKASIADGIISGGTIRMPGYTVATLPASPMQGDHAAVTDALAPSFLTIIVGGGSTYSPVVFNGSNWVGF